jgi:ketosteroid isomerase-like protein
MKHILFLAAFCCAASLQAQTQDLKAEMQTYANTWAAAHNRADAPALAAMHSDKVVFVSPKDGTTSTQTRQEIEADFVKSFSTEDSQIEIVISGAEPQPGDKVRITGSFSSKVTNKKTGEKTAYNGTFDHLVVKEKGQWKLFQMKSVLN